MLCRQFIRQNFKKQIIGMMLLLGCSAVFSTPTSIQFSVASQHISASHVQFVLKTKHAFNYKAFSLSKPNRIVFDVFNAQLKGSFSKKPQHTFLTQIRTGQHRKKYLRLVFQSNHTISAHTYIKKRASNQFEWVIDLYSRSNHSTKNVIHKLPLKILKQHSHVNSTIKNLSHQVRTTSIAVTLRNVMIVIDPGHGGKDPGAIGRYGIREKNIVLQISKKLCALINKQTGFKAVLTRSTDRYLTLRQRLSIARRYKPDLFIAIHADAYKNKKAQGASVFALSKHGATSEAARWLASRENQSELAGGLELSNVDGWLKSIMINLSQNASIHVSVNAGSQILKTLRHVSPLHYHGIEQAAFVVLKSPDIPSLLIETGFISNKKEEKRLKDSKYQDHLAHAIELGIKQYFTCNPVRETWLSAIKNAKRYHVRQGDTLSIVANRFGRSVKFLMALNHLTSTQIKIGQTIFV